MPGLANLLRRWLPSRDRPQGEEGIRREGHRAYVGGLWEELGQLQFDLLKRYGLQPHHVLLDIACGSLRLGVKAIPYLEPGHYLGVEKEEALVRAGLEQELEPGLAAVKMPEILLSAEFEFERLSQRPDFAIAQSLFTHLAPDRIALCFERLRPVMKPESLFLATFFECERPARNPDRSHDHGYFAYTREQMLAFGADQGFAPAYVGEWGHPRGQMLVEFRCA